MKIKLGALRNVIKEAIAPQPAERTIPKSGDIFLSPEGRKVYVDPIIDADDLATMSPRRFDKYELDDYDDEGKPPGPGPGEPGVIFQIDSGPAYNLRPGELVRVPKRDEGKKLAWALKKDLPKIKELAASDKGGPGVDAAMLKMLTHVSTRKVGMNDVADFRFRARKNNIVFETVDMYGHIKLTDLAGPLKALGIEGVAKWMLAHGAGKMKNERRRPMMPYYD